jgi:hypothetical protein
MAEKLDPKELVSFEELLRANMIQTDAVAQLLIEKGLITEQEFTPTGLRIYCLNPF